MQSNNWRCRLLEIRPVIIEDAETISRIRRQDGVREGVLALTSERLEATVDFLKCIGGEDRAYAAIEGNDLLGIAVLLNNKSPRRPHCATVAVMVDADYQGRGIGKLLMRHLVDQADNLLKLHRLELYVLADNVPAISLYQKLGFNIEATRKHAAAKDGKFINEYFLGRINPGGDVA